MIKLQWLQTKLNLARLCLISLPPSGLSTHEGTFIFYLVSAGWGCGFSKCLCKNINFNCCDSWRSSWLPFLFTVLEAQKLFKITCSQGFGRTISLKFYAKLHGTHDSPDCWYLQGNIIVEATFSIAKFLIFPPSGPRHVGQQVSLGLQCWQTRWPAWHWKKMKQGCT